MVMAEGRVMRAALVRYGTEESWRQAQSITLVGGWGKESMNQEAAVLLFGVEGSGSGLVQQLGRDYDGMPRRNAESDD